MSTDTLSTDWTDTVTVNGHTIRVLVLWSDDLLVNIVLRDHWDTDIALTAVRAYIDGPLTKLAGENPYDTLLGSESEVWDDAASRLDVGYGRLRELGPDHDEWDWSNDPADGFVPVMSLYVGE
ncbi:hypothetical protein [Glutamicibacter sp. V16R2B1]|uniref:hypothetical protein n=1 Tax=Glutamicibacter sp. V16R2B1 TaxID=2036207 RepID=UPI0010FE5B70|nr:hypothetical protein [Glutamicibacter sp. V16R2B1]MCK9901321.1 hypothetical protein [Frankia sp. Cpl3]TLK47695.1 hypothetical protein FDN03_15715 [Glutamicibacter sp. V16R2B1]